MVAVFKGLTTEIDSVKAIGSMEVGVTCEEPNVFDSISGVRPDTELLSASRKVEIDFMNRGQGHSCHPNEMSRREQRR